MVKKTFWHAGVGLARATVQPGRDANPVQHIHGVALGAQVIVKVYAMVNPDINAAPKAQNLRSCAVHGDPLLVHLAPP